MDEQRRRQETDDVGGHPEHIPMARSSRWIVVIWVVIAIVVLALIVFLHASGAIGPGVHQGG